MRSHVWKTFPKPLRHFGGCSVTMTTNQVEQHEQLMGEFEGKYTELKNHCFEMQHNFFRAVEEHEEGFFNSMAQLAQVTKATLGRLIINTNIIVIIMLLLRVLLLLLSLSSSLLSILALPLSSLLLLLVLLSLLLLLFVLAEIYSTFLFCLFFYAFSPASPPPAPRSPPSAPFLIF